MGMVNHNTLGGGGRAKGVNSFMLSMSKPRQDIFGGNNSIGNLYFHLWVI